VQSQTLRILTLFLLPASTVVLADTVLTIGANFTGVSLTQSGFIPPDTDGAIGPSSYAEFVNGRFATYTKTGTSISSITDGQFWRNAGLTGIANNSVFDPRIIYDPNSGHWYASELTTTVANQNSLLLAASAGNNPAGPWTAVSVAGTVGQFWDFDTLGLNGLTLAAGINEFPNAGGSATTGFVTIPKSDLVAGISTNLQTLTEINPNNTGFSAHPVTNFGPTGASIDYVSAFNTPAGFINQGALVAGTPLATTRNLISVPANSGPVDARQPGGPNNLDAADGRFGTNPFEMGNLIYVVQTGVSGAGRDEILYYVINASTHLLVDKGAISDPILDFIYPSIAVDSLGNAVIGFTATGPNAGQFPSSYAVLGTSAGAVPGGTLTFGTPLLLKSGLASYQQLDNLNRNRWGDYSATQFDASTNSFWTIQEFAGTGNVWFTQITQLEVVPEPATIGLGIASMALMCGLARRRSRRGTGA
jgi:hypothetical protein